MYWERIQIILMQFFYKRKIKDIDQIKRHAILYKQYSEISAKFLRGKHGSNVESIGYDWTSWSGLIRSTFANGVPLCFLSNPIISSTMVFARNNGVKLTNAFVSNVVNVFGEKNAIKLLTEDYIGSPNISNLKYLTSANRAHHANHLAYFTEATNKYLWDSRTIVEWGGGYGNMARIIRKINPLTTYIIIDLPELLALQYIYLSSVETKANVNLVVDDDGYIKHGKINLITQEKFAEVMVDINCDCFISTWAITESPQSAQDFVRDYDFFSAKNLLIGSLLNENNFLVDSIGNKEVIRKNLPESSGVGVGHEYWFR